MSAFQDVLDSFEQVSFAVLIGSRAKGTARPDSDWDICVWIPRDLGGLTRLGLLEDLRFALAQALKVSADAVDIVDLAFSGLAMRATAADEGILLKQDTGSLYNRFLNRTWRELEEFAWEKRHAA